MAESVVVAALFTMAARELAQIMAHLQRTNEAEQMQKLADDMTATTQRHGWDGDWFLRAYDHFGNPVGSQSCAEGRIYIEPQGLCPMAGIGVAEGLAESALAAAGKHLAFEHGIKLLDPPYRQYYLHLGEISSYPPGYKENGSVFCHTNPWMMIAEAILSHGEKALDYYLRINPSKREEISELHHCEPYVYAQMITGPDADHPGEAKNSWLTGTAAWNFVAITQWILGIRPDYGGLRIDPVLPEGWQGYHAVRKFRGAVIEIDVQRKGSGNSLSMTVDGGPVPGTLVPVSGQERVAVKVSLGGPPLEILETGE